MSTVQNLAAFAGRVAQKRAAWFNVSGDADAQTPNFSTADGRKVRLAFSVFANAREAVDAGFEANCQARAFIPDSLGLTLSADPAHPTDFTALVAGEGYAIGNVFRVVWFLKNPAAAETRVGLRKRQS